MKQPVGFSALDRRLSYIFTVSYVSMNISVYLAEYSIYLKADFNECAD